MKIKATELVTKLGEAIARAKDPNIEVVLDGITYLHARGTRAHRLELVDVIRAEQHAEQQRQLEQEILRLRAQLQTYQEAYG